MPMDSSAIDELKKLIKLAKAKPMTYALALGKKPADLVLMMDKRKPEEVLLRLVKKEDGINKQKSCSGKATLEGNKLMLQCEGEPPTGLMRNLKAFFKDNKIPYKPLVVSPDGSVFEAEGAEDTVDQPTEETQAAPTPSGPSPAELAARVKELQPVIAGLDDKPKNQLSTALRKGVDLIKAGKLDEAAELLDKIETLAGQSAPKAPPPPPPPGGDPDDGPSTSPKDALAERWRATADKLVPHIKKALSSGKGDPDKIRAVWSYAKGKAEAEDYAAALKSLGPLSNLLSQAAEAQTTAAQEEVAKGDDTRQKLEAWEAVKAEMEPLVKAAIKAKDARSTKVGAAWDMALKAASTGDFDKANTIVGKLSDVLKPKADQPGSDSATDDPGKAEALRKLEAAKGVLIQVGGQITAFGDPKPKDWEVPHKAAQKLLAISADKSSEEIEAAVAQALDLLAKLGEAVTQLTLEKQNWLKQEPLFVSRLAPIQAHNKHGTNPVKDKLKALEDELAAARKEAEQFKFQDAAGRIGAFLTKADELEALADDFAHYDAIREDREDSVNEVKTWPAAYPKVREAYDAAIAAYDDAVEKAGNEDYEGAVALLNKFPALYDKAALLRERHDEVDPAKPYSYMTLVRKALDKLNALPDAVKTLLKDGIKRVQDAYDASQPDKEPDVVKAAEKLTLAEREAGDLKARAGKAKAYIEAREKFDTKLGEFKDHEGHEGVDDVIDRMESDSISAGSDAILRKYDAATKILMGTEPKWAEYKTRADDFLAYSKKKKEVESRLEALRKDPNAGSASSELAVCDGHLKEAATLAATRDYKGALVSVNAADTAADVVKTLLEMRAKLAELKSGEVEGDKDEGAGYKLYKKMSEFVGGKDDGTFTSLIQKADQEAAKDRSVQSKSSPYIDAAMNMLEDVTNKIACKASYDTLLGTVKPEVKVNLPAENSSNYDCIGTQIEALDKLVDAAEAAVKPAALDYPEGLKKLNEAQTKVQEARKDLALFKTADPEHDELETIKDKLILSRDKALTYTDPIDPKHSIQIEIDKVGGFYQSFLDDWYAGKHKESVAKLKKDIKLARAYLAMRLDYVKAIRRREDWIYDDEDRIKDDPLVQKERDDIAAAKIKIDGYLEQRAFKTACKVINDESFAIDRGAELLEKQAAFKLKKTATKAKVVEAETEAGKVASNTKLGDKVKALRKRYDDAVAETDVAKRNFDEATRLIDALLPDCQPVIDEAKLYQTYEASRKTAEDKIQEVKDDKNSHLVEPLIKRLTGKYDNAVALADKGNINQAKALADAIPKECADALAAAKNNAALEGVSSELEGIDEGDDAAVREAVEKVRQVYDTLKWESEAEYASEENALAEQAVEAAEALLSTDAKAAKAALPKAIAACEALQIQIGYHKQLFELATRTTARVNGGMAAYVKYDIIKEDTDALTKKIDDALKGAQRGGSVDAASASIEEAMKTYQDLLTMGKRHDQVITDRDDLEAKRKALLGHAHRYAIRDDLERLNLLLQQAGETAEKRDHDAAEAHIKEAKDLAVDASTKAKMAANEVPEADDIKAIIGREGGDKHLDKMIEGLDPSAQRKVLRVAFEAKYGCKLNIYKEAKDKQTDRHAAGNISADGDKKGPNIRRLYEVMTILPPKDTRANDSMKIFGYEDVKSQEGSYYSGGPKEVVMREGNASLSEVYGFGRPHEVGEVDDNCKPVDDEQVDFFSWNTLHEVGHAVDDQRGFMKGVEGNTKYGGWQEHGGDVKPIADAIAGLYKYDVDYTTQYIGGSDNPPEPDCPSDVDPSVWEQRRTKVRAHVDMARAGNNPWQSAAIAAKLNINGRVYHESYDSGSWNSYEFAARRQAITGYQFRAPGEWFSELYAAYHAKKLKDNHPAVEWLSKLK